MQSLASLCLLLAFANNLKQGPNKKTNVPRPLLQVHHLTWAMAVHPSQYTGLAYVNLHTYEMSHYACVPGPQGNSKDSVRAQFLHVSTGHPAAGQLFPSDGEVYAWEVV